MKDKELRIGFRFFALHPMLESVTIPDDPYCSYDFECNYYIIEVKARDKYYNEWLIEKLKARNNLKISKEIRKQFLYLSEYQGICYVHNVSKMVDEGYDFKWEKRNLPATTEFNKTKWIEKEVGYMHINKSKQINIGETSD